MAEGYSVQCFNCLSDFDALEAIWCSCNPQRPTKVCPFCLGCFCAAGQQFKDAFWSGAPASLQEEIRTLSESRMLIGEMLVRAGIISTSQLLDALNRQKADGRRLGEILVDRGALSPERLESFLQSQHTVTVVDVSRARVDANMLRRLGVERCLKEKILPLEAEAFRDRHIMTLAMADPSNTGAVGRVMKATGYQVIPGVAPGETIVSAIRALFPHGAAPEGAPAPRAVESRSAQRMLSIAVTRRASHIHIQGQGVAAKVHYRIDGGLYLDRARARAEGDRGSALAAFRALAGLDRQARPAAPVGRALVDIDGAEHQIIVRSRRGRDGEELSVKILDPVRFPPRLDDLGLSADSVDRLRLALDRDIGLLVVSAPPFSGASSTVYALVMEIVAQGRPLALVESPRAVTLTDAAQEEFFPEVPGSFADALARATSSGARVLAITAAEGISWLGEPGNFPERMLVICRVESGSLPDALLRLVAAGYPTAGLGSRPTLVLHQRLVRRLCSSCRREVATAEEHASALRLPPAEARRIKIWRAAGCEECGPAPGFRGQVPLVQALRISRAVAEAVASGSLERVAAACAAAGLIRLREEALAVLHAGLTTPEEVTRRPLA